MTDVEAIVDGLVAGSQGATALAVREARLRLEQWTMLDCRSDRVDRIELIDEAAQILSELSLSYVE